VPVLAPIRDGCKIQVGSIAQKTFFQPQSMHLFEKAKVHLYGLILFRPSNTIIPRITINERGLIIKGDIFKKVISIDWTDVKEITYRSFALDLKLSDKSIKTLDLPTTADKSIEIKKSIREICDNKNITIEGG
jgi:hypothetical protein